MRRGTKLPRATKLNITNFVVSIRYFVCTCMYIKSVNRIHGYVSGLFLKLS